MFFSHKTRRKLLLKVGLELEEEHGIRQATGRLPASVRYSLQEIVSFLRYHFIFHLQRNLTEAQKGSLIKDFHGLNLSKYISEAAVAIVDAKLKVNRKAMVCRVCHLTFSREPFATPVILCSGPLKFDII